MEPLHTPSFVHCFCTLPIKEQTPNRVLLDMSQLARGLYLIRVETTQGFYHEKLIKE